MALFEALVDVAQQTGLLGIFVPFILVFAVFYGVLRKAEIFGKGRPGSTINAIISVVAAFYVVLASPFAQSIIGFFGAYFSFQTIFVLALISGVILWSLIQPKGKGAKSLVTIMAFIVVVGALSYAFSLQKALAGIAIGPVGISPADALIIFLILIFVGIFWFLISGEKETKEGQGG